MHANSVAFGAMYFHPQLAQNWLGVSAVGVCAVGAGTLLAWAIARRRRPSAKQIEERRRQRLAASGRIVDGSLVDAEPLESAPQTIIYRYRIAGVTYECSQDVSTLSALVKNIRLDFPVQVRYNRANPADSIVVAETWNGLWTNIWHASGSRRRQLTEQKQQ